MSTLASNDSTISEEVPIEYENKVAIHDATENYYEGGIHACRSCNNIKFPLYVLKVLKLYLFCLPMLVDSCSYKLCAHKSLGIGSWLYSNVLVIFFMMLSLCFNSYLFCEHH